MGDTSQNASRPHEIALMFDSVAGTRFNSNSPLYGVFIGAMKTKTASTILKTTADSAEIIAAAIYAARPKRGEKRGTFPRFLVLADGGAYKITTVKALAELISTVKQGEDCYIFRNYGHGATLTFDRPDWWPLV